MRIAELGLDTTTLLAARWSRGAEVDSTQWQASTNAAHRLVALWGDRRQGQPWVAAVCAFDDGLLWLELPVPAGGYPDLTPRFVCASRMQRAAEDLHAVLAAGARDRRPWLDHGRFDRSRPGAADYEFVRVEGDGVHEIPAWTGPTGISCTPSPSTRTNS